MAQFRMAPMRSLAFGSISGTYAPVGTPLNNVSLITWIENNTDADLIVSFDGVNDHLFMPSRSGKVVDISTNKDPRDSLGASIGTYFHVKQDSGAPSTGSLYISIGYAR